MKFTCAARSGKNVGCPLRVKADLAGPKSNFRSSVIGETCAGTCAIFIPGYRLELLTRNSSLVSLEILNMSTLTPHGACLLWKPELIWLNAVYHARLAGAYFAIAFVLGYFVWRRTMLCSAAYSGHSLFSPRLRPTDRPMPVVSVAGLINMAVTAVTSGTVLLCLFVAKRLL
jgi:hypothetical protein